MDYQPVDVPPVPAEGLPPGWSMEQWNAYGHAWVKQQEGALTEPNTDIGTSDNGTETELNIPTPITTDDGVTHTPMAESIPITEVSRDFEYEQGFGNEELTGSEELAILVGSLFIFYAAIDFLISLFGIWFPGPFFTPMLFGGVGSAIIHYKSYWNFIGLEPFSKSQNTKYVLGGVLGSALLLILVILLVSIADDEIVGTWHNPDETVTFNSDGTVTGDEMMMGTKWRVDGDMVYLTYPDEPDYEYYYKYSISKEVLFIGPMSSDDTVDDCLAFAKEGVDWYDALEEARPWPSWCDY